MTEINILIALLPIIFMIHDFEEIIMFKPWLTKNSTEIKRRFPKLDAFLTKKTDLWPLYVRFCSCRIARISTYFHRNFFVLLVWKSPLVVCRLLRILHSPFISYCAMDDMAKICSGNFYLNRYLPILLLHFVCVYENRAI